MYVIYFWITLVLWEYSWKEMALGFTFNVHYQVLMELSKLKLAEAPKALHAF